MRLLRLLALLLLLCVSSSRAASLIHARQTLEETEAPPLAEEDPATDSPAEEPLVVDSPAAVAPVVNDAALEAPGVDSSVEGATAEDSPAAESPVAADVPLETQADSPAEEEAPVADSSIQLDEEAQDTTARDPQVAADEPAPDSPAAETPGIDAPVDAAAAADTPAGEDVLGEALIEDKMAADAPVDDTMVADAPVDAKMVAESPLDDTMVADAPVDETLTAQADAADEGMDADVAVDDMMAADAPAENIPADVQENAFPLEEDEDIMSPLPPSVQANTGSDWALNSIRHSFQAVNSYFDSMVELMGGRNGVCQYRCRYGKTPTPRVGYLLPEPNGCSSSLLGFEFDLGIPAMTKCCNQLDECYDTCGSNKNRCDSKFRWCLHGICSELKKSLGFVSKVEVCESMADAMYNTVWTLGCRSYMTSQRAACFCEGEERDEL